MNADRTILIAGASKGIGYATAVRLLDSGYSVVVSSRDESTLYDKFKDFDDTRVKIMPWDFSEPGRIQEYAENVYKSVGAVFGLVYSAGIQLTLPLSMSGIEQINKIFAVNTFSAMELVRCFSKKKMLHNSGASFVLISSLAAREGALGKSLYGASKGALEGYVPSVAAELAQRKIRVNCIAPGIVDTDMSREFRMRMSQEQREALSASYPLGLGRAEDVASFIHWLLSDESSWATGQTYVIDGGHMVRG